MEALANVPPKATGRPKLGRNILTCAGLLILVCVLVVFFVAYLISLTGIIEFPILKSFYQPPIPTRQIQYKQMDLKDFEALISSRAREEARKGAKKIVIPINEKEVSGLFAWGLNQGLRNNMEIEQSQVAILPAGLEIFTKLKWSLGRVDLLVRVKPELEPGGSVKFLPIDAKLGSVSLPLWLITPVISNIFSKDMGAWDLQAGDMKIQSLVLKDGKIMINFQLISN